MLCSEWAIIDIYWKVKSKPFKSFDNELKKYVNEVYDMIYDTGIDFIDSFLAYHRSMFVQH